MLRVARCGVLFVVANMLLRVVDVCRVSCVVCSVCCMAFADNGLLFVV